MTYAEFLKSQGATEEDIKVMDTAIGRKAFEKLQADSEAAIRTGEEAKQAAKAEKERLNSWFEGTAVPEYKEMERRAIAAEAEVAKARGAWKAAQERGLVDLEQTKALGWDNTPVNIAPVNTNNTNVIDPSKYVTSDYLRTVSDGVGEGLAVLQDIVMEHSQLFPDKPLRVRELRKEAVASGKTVEQYWIDRYGVNAAREKRESDQKAAYEKRLREEGAAAARTELASQYGNPDTRPMAPSNSPFTKRPSTGRDKQPWDRQEDPVNDRVARATQKLIERSNPISH